MTDFDLLIAKTSLLRTKLAAPADPGDTIQPGWGSTVGNWMTGLGGTAAAGGFGGAAALDRLHPPPPHAAVIEPVRNAAEALTSWWNSHSSPRHSFELPSRPPVEALRHGLRKWGPAAGVAGLGMAGLGSLLSYFGHNSDLGRANTQLGSSRQRLNDALARPQIAQQAPSPPAPAPTSMGPARPQTPTFQAAAPTLPAAQPPSTPQSMSLRELLGHTAKRVFTEGAGDLWHSITKPRA